MERLSYVSINNMYACVITVPYLERRNIKIRAKSLMDLKFEGFRPNVGWKTVSKSWIEVYKGMLNLLKEADVQIEVFPIKSFRDGLEVAKDQKDKVDRVYVSEMTYTSKDKDLFYVRVDESILTQLASLVSGIYGYLDILANNPDSTSAKTDLTKYYFEINLDEKIVVGSLE